MEKAATAFDQSHVFLHEDLHRLEQALTSAAPAGLRPSLETLREHLLKHFRQEEEGGYMTSIREQNPRLEHQVENLALEHGVLTRTLDEILGEAGKIAQAEEEIRSRVTTWIRKLRDHENREVELVQNAFNQDIGNKD